MAADTRPVPLKLQALRALTAHLEGIHGPDAGGFDLRGCVYRGRNQFGADAPKTFISILEAPRPDGGIRTGEQDETRSERWPLLLQGWLKEDDDAEHPLDAIYYLLDQVERRLNRVIEENGRNGFPVYPAEFMLGLPLTGFGFGPGTVRPATDGISSKAFMYMPMWMGLATVG